MQPRFLMGRVHSNHVKAWTCFLLLIAVDAAAADLQPRTVAAFERYARLTESRLDSRAPFLWIDSLPQPRRHSTLDQLRGGGLVIERLTTREGGIAEVEDAGTPNERELPVGRDGGYLWRLNTYWRLLERDGGTYLQCESISLSRAIPTGLGWLVGPFVTSIPRESLAFTLETPANRLRSRRE